MSRNRMPCFAIALAIALLTAAPVKADCVWVPLCLPPHDPPYEALRLYLDGELSHEYRPMWGFQKANWSRVNIWACGPASARMTLSVVLGDQESDRTQMRVIPGEPSGCPVETGTVPAVHPTLGSNYGPIEQLLRAVRRNQAGDPRPVDTDRDGAIRPNDLELLRRTAERRFADSTTRLCADDDCP